MTTMRGTLLDRGIPAAAIDKLPKVAAWCVWAIAIYLDRRDWVMTRRMPNRALGPYPLAWNTVTRAEAEQLEKERAGGQVQAATPDGNAGKIFEGK